MNTTMLSAVMAVNKLDDESLAILADIDARFG